MNVNLPTQLKNFTHITYIEVQYIITKIWATY